MPHQEQSRLKQQPGHLVLTDDRGRVSLHVLGDAKVQELQLALDKDEVCRLQVAVDNPLIVDRPDRL